MAFALKPGDRVVIGHVGGARAVGLRRTPSSKGGDNFTGESVDNGEAVAIIAMAADGFCEVARQDSVRGFVRVQHLHVQAWPPEGYEREGDGARGRLGSHVGVGLWARRWQEMVRQCQGLRARG